MLYLYLLFIFLSTTAFSQTYRKTASNEIIYGISLGYANQAGNFGKVGAFTEVSFGDAFFLKADVNANLTGMQNQFNVIPELGFTLYYLETEMLLLGAFVETEITPHTITPKIGLTAITFFDIGFGYGFEFNQKENFKSLKGFQFSVGLNIPLNFNIY